VCRLVFPFYPVYFFGGIFVFFRLGSFANAGAFVSTWQVRRSGWAQGA